MKHRVVQFACIVQCVQRNLTGILV